MEKCNKKENFVLNQWNHICSVDLKEIDYQILIQIYTDHS